MIQKKTILNSIILIMCLPLLWSSCSKSDEGMTSLDIFNIEPIGEKDIQFDELQMDTLRLDRIESSHVGFISISNDSIRFIDERFGWMFVFDKNGVLHHRHLGQGQGPKEIPMAGIQFYSPTIGRGHIFIGSSFDYYIYNSDYERTKQEIIRWQRDVPMEELQRNPDPQQQRSYNLGYDIGNIMVTSTHVYLPLISAPPPFSAFNFTTDLFAEEARVLAKMNIETGEVENIMGRLSPIFAEELNIRHFSFFHNTLIDNSTLAISYMPDSLIYLTDLDFNVQSAFGFSGENMDLNYRIFPSVGNEETIQNFFYEEFNNRGYYTSLTYIKDRDLFFRGYRKGGESTTDGLQVYRGNTLIADVDVPKLFDEFVLGRHFEVIGYIEPWFYSNAFIDEMAEEIIVYRFRIDE